MSTTETLTINRILNTVAERGATDIHFVIGNYPYLRVRDKLTPLTEEELINPEMMESIINFFVPQDKKEFIKERKELKFVYDWLSKARFRVHIFQQKGFFSVSLKLISNKIKTLEELDLPKIVNSFIKNTKGLLFISGPYNSGRSATVAAIIQTINQTRSEHILYLEEPIEQLFVSQKSIIEQREVGLDVSTFAEGLKSVKDEDVDVVVVSRIPTAESLEVLLELAESGRLVIAILDYDSVTSVFNGIVSEFTEEKVVWARNVLAESLIGIIVQQLVPKVSGGMALAIEILTQTPSSKALIKEGRFAQLESIIQTSRAEGMTSLDRALSELVKKGEVSAEEAVKYARNPKTFKAALSK